MTKQVFQVEGMTCDHCGMKVTRALESVPGVQKVKVSVRKNQAEVKYGEATEVQSLFLAVQDVGYHLRG